MAAWFEVAIDANCGFCGKSAEWLKALDWLGAVRIRPVDEPGMPEMRVTRLSDGVTRGGFDGFRMMALAIPLFSPGWLALYVPPVPWIGRKIYGWVVRHRAILPGGCQSDVCALPTDTKAGSGSVASSGRAAERLPD
jgi:hypothetical protein